MKARILLFLLILALLVPVLGQELQTLAILEFEAIGISETEAKVLTNRLRTNLATVGLYVVVDRGQMEQILLEQDFLLTGCTSNVCAVEVGQMIGAQLMIIGSFSKFGVLYTIEMQLIDVSTGRIMRSVTQDIRGGLESVLTEGIAEVAKQISGQFGIISAEVSDNSGANLPTAATPADAVRLRTDTLRIAVVQFQEKGNLGIEEAGEIVAGWMSNSLHQTGIFILYERVLLQDVLAEQDIGITGVIDESTTAEIGKVYGVEAIVTGTISKFGSTFSITTRLVDTKTAKVIATATIRTKDIDTIAEATDGLAMELATVP